MYWLLVEYDERLVSPAFGKQIQHKERLLDTTKEPNPNDGANHCYVVTLPDSVHEAAMRISVRLNGAIASDVWESKLPPFQGHDEDAEMSDYELIARQYDWLHSNSGLDTWSKAEIWVYDFIDDIHAARSSS